MCYLGGLHLRASTRSEQARQKAGPSASAAQPHPRYDAVVSRHRDDGAGGHGLLAASSGRR
jgi:hypothetical protein